MFELVERVILSRKKRNKKLLEYMDLIINYLNKKRVWEGWELLDGYTYLKDMIKLCTGYCVDQISKMIEAVGKRICLNKLGGKTWLLWNFSKKGFWVCIGCILLAVNFGNKGHILWGKNHTSATNKEKNYNMHRWSQQADLLKVCCDIYCYNYSYLCH